MSIRLFTTSLALFICFASAGRAAPLPAAPVTPEELHASNGGRVWVYLPKNTPADAKLPCVLIAPAGSRMFHGMGLGEGDNPEHLPWVAAGFAVISYDISGPLPEPPNDASMVKAAAEFRRARFGVNDGLSALDAALAKHPQIDPGRVYVAGHSSAATLALQLAAASDRFKACAAFAPVVDVADHLKKALPALDHFVPGFAEAIRAASPANRADAIQCPVFLFHADDDEKVTGMALEAYRDALLAHHKTVDYVTVPSGGHYDSMIGQGVPRAIAWVKTLDRKLSKP